MSPAESYLYPDCGRQVRRFLHPYQRPTAKTHLNALRRQTHAEDHYGSRWRIQNSLPSVLIWPLVALPLVAVCLVVALVGTKVRPLRPATRSEHGILLNGGYLRGIGIGSRLSD